MPAQHTAKGTKRAAGPAEQPAKRTTEQHSSESRLLFYAVPEEAIIPPVEGSKAATIASTDDDKRDVNSSFDERFLDNFDGIDWSLLSRFCKPPRTQTRSKSWIYSYGYRVSLRSNPNEIYFVCKFCHQRRLLDGILKVTQSTTSAIAHLRQAKVGHGFTKGGLKVPPNRAPGQQSLAMVAGSGVEISQEIANKLGNFNVQAFRYAAVTWLVENNHPLYELETPAFRSMISFANPEAEDALWKSANSVKAYAVRLYEFMVPQVIAELSQSLSKIHISFDGWTAKGGKRGLFGIVVHYANASGKLVDLPIALPQLTGAHTGERIADIVAQTLQKFEISLSKLGCFVLDNAYTNDTAVTYLAGQYGFTAAYHRLRCGPHTLNLIGQAIIFGKDPDSYDNDAEEHEAEEILIADWRKNGPLGVLIDVINYINTPQQYDLFNRFQHLANAELPINDQNAILEPIKPVVTRWNSYYSCFERAIKLQHAVSNYANYHIQHTRNLDDIARRQGNKLPNVPSWMRSNGLTAIDWAMPPDSDTIDVELPRIRQEIAELEGQIQNEIEMEATQPATPTQNLETSNIFEIPILPPNKRQANFSPEKTRTHRRTRSNFSPFIGSTLRNPFSSQNRTPKATTVEEALEIARNLVIQAANLAENNPTQQTSLLDLVEVFRDYTETGRVSKKNSAILGDQISSLSNVSKELRDKVRRLEKPIPAQPNQQGDRQTAALTQPISYAAIAAANKEQQWTTMQKKAPQKAKPSLKERQLVLVNQGGPAAFDALRLRNAFNQAFTLKGGVQSPVVASVTLSSKGNKVVTTTPAFTANYLLENQGIWKDLVAFKVAQPITSWFKIVVHRLPTNHGLEVIKEEIETFNKGLKVVGTPFWLTPESKRGQQSYGSACVAFATEEEALKAIRGKLYILGESLRAEKLRVINNLKQCSKCQGFGHLEARNSPATESALDLAIKVDARIVAVQEPWLPKGSSYENTRSTAHQDFTQILPTPKDTSLRPRVLFYIRKDLKGEVNPFISDDNDFLAIKVLASTSSLYIYNIYNEKSLQEGLNKTTIQRRLLQEILQPQSIILGDFNTHHPRWSLEERSPSTQAEELVEWIDTQDLTLLNTPGAGTFLRSHMRQESVLDLTFATSNTAASILDWQTIPELPSQPASLPKQYNTKRTDWTTFKETLGQEIKVLDLEKRLSTLPPCSNYTSRKLILGQNILLETKLDELGEDLTRAIQKALEKSTPLVNQKPKTKPWWTSELDSHKRDLSRAYRAYKKEAAKENNSSLYQWKREYLRTKNRYLKAIQRAKQSHWEAFLQKDSPKEIFKALAYTKDNLSTRIPAIKGKESFTKKCKAFREDLFPPPPTTATPSFHIYRGDSRWTWPALTEDELSFACCYHPRCWRKAKGVILRKPNKPDYSIPKAYRVISLLNCLGKVLERLVARRLGALAETTDLLHPSQLGGRLKKSAIDAALLFYNNIQQQKRKQKTTTTIFLDIKGAFDHVSKNKLLEVMKDQGLPCCLLAWTKSFLEDRILQLSFDGQTEEPQVISTGTPQGSPASPILFLIYSKPLFNAIQTNANIYSSSYIDDLQISISSTSVRKNIKLLEKEIQNLFRLAEESAIQFDSSKTELVNWTRSRKDQARVLTLPNQEIVQSKELVRWLGVYFDCSLKFKHHSLIRNQQASAAFHRLSRLANSNKGLSPRAVRQLYLACITSVADYGCQIFWREQQTALNQRQKLQNQACRKILGSFRTSPAIPSEVEAALCPPRVRLNNALRQYAFRARKLAPSHPLNIAITSNQGKQLERITRSISTALSDDSEEIKHYASMPWSSTMPYKTNISKKSKEIEAKHHKELLEDEYLLSIYSDASATKEGKGIGVGVAFYKGASLIAYEKVNIGYNQLVYNGELEGITLGLEKAFDLADDYLEVRVYADNQAAIFRLKTASDYPGQEWQLRCTIAAEKLQEKGILPTIQWVPGHQGVIGNERADALAKEATKLDPSSSRTSLAVIGTRIKQLGEREWLSYLGQYRRKAITLNPTTYAARYKWKTRKQIATPPTSREASSAFYQLKLGHCYLRDFLFKRGKVDSKVCPCNYRATQDPAHILLSCTLYKEARKKMQETTKDPLSLAFLLDTTPLKQATKQLEGRGKLGQFGALYSVIPVFETLLHELEERVKSFEYVNYEEPGAPEDHLPINLRAAWSKANAYYFKLDSSPFYYAATILHPYYKRYCDRSWRLKPEWLRA
ncbi:hypothetical protein BM1_00705 [Bipolaris maydis]|nr:hypothetical protein BM1_00705 [Bipolaris maydis]